MSNLTKIEFVALNIIGNNYLPWKLYVEIWLEAKSLGETIKKDNTAFEQDRAKALIFLRHHIDEEQNNQLLLKNHESRPTGSAALLEACAASASVPEVHAANFGPRNGRGRGRGHGRGRGRGDRNYLEPNRHAPYRQQRYVDTPNDRQQRHIDAPNDRQQRHYNKRGRGRGSS